jgi:3-oxoacyl-[acyl-carrier-protein] synthase III
MNPTQQVGIAGIGFYVPDKIVSNVDLESKMHTSDEWIRSRTGISERRVAADTEAASDLGVKAAEYALTDAGVDPESIDLIICATASADMPFPATACLIQDRIGAKNAGAFDLSAVCSGFLYALITGANMISSGQAQRVLVVAAEKFSSLLDWEDRSTGVLMGDGAGAVILTADAKQGKIISSCLGADSSGIEHLHIPAGGSALPTSHETVDQKQHFMKMNGPEIYKFGVRVIGESVSQVLSKAGLDESQLDLLIPHQANIRIIQSASKRFHLPMDKIVVNIEKYSNTSAASVPIALAEAKQSGRLKPGMHVALVAFGAGLTWGAAILKW